jgi:hypothetical protein
MTYSTVWHLKQMVTSEESGKPFLNFLMWSLYLMTLELIS